MLPIGWRVTEEDLADYPHLRFATGENDTGVIVAFNSEAEDVTGSLLVPAGVRSLCINPLNWRTDDVPASREENLGACFTDYSGEILTEIPQLTGAYVDQTRGTLKVPDVSPEAYPPVLSIFEPGVYHLYDYQFFYRIYSRMWAFAWRRTWETNLINFCLYRTRYAVPHLLPRKYFAGHRRTVRR